MSRIAFGPNLRRIRLQRGISMFQIAQGTKIAPELLDGLEQNDLSQWPVGIYARAYVRQYALAIGVDPDATVDEFCRWFPQGDRRAEPLVRGQAEIVGHQLEWHDDNEDVNRRGQIPAQAGSAARFPSQSPLSVLFMRLRRTFGKA